MWDQRDGPVGKNACLTALQTRVQSLDPHGGRRDSESCQDTHTHTHTHKKKKKEIKTQKNKHKNKNKI